MQTNALPGVLRSSCALAAPEQVSWEQVVQAHRGVAPSYPPVSLVAVGCCASQDRAIRICMFIFLSLRCLK